jgi:hypothetical protein
MTGDDEILRPDFIGDKALAGNEKGKRLLRRPSAEGLLAMTERIREARAPLLPPMQGTQDNSVIEYNLGKSED